MFKNQTIPVMNVRSPNRVAPFAGFHLSYNPSSADYGSDTTALVFQNNLFFTLNGDHQAALFKLAEGGGWQACFDYYVENIHHANRISDHHLVLNGDPHFGLDVFGLEFLGEGNVQRLREASEALEAAA